MKLPINKKTFFKMMRFGLVGVFNTGLDLAVLNLLIYLFGVSDPFMFSIYKGISFVCALTSSYFLNKYFTFKVDQSSKRVFLIFVFFSLIGFIANVILSSFVFYILSLYNDVLSVHLIATISAAVGALLSAILNYFNYSYFVFK
jgi:putative flippase GtrA